MSVYYIIPQQKTFANKLAVVRLLNVEKFERVKTGVAN